MIGRPFRFALLADGPSDRALQLPLLDEMRAMIELFQPELLLVHRDAEAQDPESRRAEIPVIGHATVKVVPVRMTEAWLLFDEAAIRRAADRPRGRAPLGLPAPQRVEQLPDPKGSLREALLAAAEVTGRRRKRFEQELGARVQRIAELIDDFAPLRRLSAFRRFEQDCGEALDGLGIA